MAALAAFTSTPWMFLAALFSVLASPSTGLKPLQLKPRPRFSEPLMVALDTLALSGAITASAPPIW